MKKNITAPVFKILMLLAFVVILKSCKKGPPDPANQITANMKYKFSNPQNIERIPTNVDYVQRSFVSIYHVYNRNSSSVTGMEFDKDGNTNNKNFGFSFPNELITNFRQINPGTGPFCIDKNEQYLYVVVKHHLYKCNMATSNVVNVTPSTLNIGVCSFIKVLDNGDVIIATDLNNGSIQEIANGSSTPNIIVSNLGTAPSAIDMLNNEFYFTLDLNNGSVKKVTSSGSLATVIDNLTHPRRLVFDNNSNLIVETQITLDGANYGQYSIYTKAGSKLIDITDSNNILILSSIGTENMVPLYVDSNNNLFFSHLDIVSSSTINHSNPYMDVNPNHYFFIYKLQLIKQ